MRPTTKAEARGSRDRQPPGDDGGQDGGHADKGTGGDLQEAMSASFCGFLHVDTPILRRGQEATHAGAVGERHEEVVPELR